MAKVMQMRWPSITQEQYEQARLAVGWEDDIPEGAIFHVSWFEDGLRVVDVWETEDDFYRFVGERLMPKLKELGIGEDEPDVQFREAYAYFAPVAART